MTHSDETEMERAKARAAASSIGFLSLAKTKAGEDAKCAGSGTLVSIGKIHGILTAAHVLAELPRTGQIGILQFPPNAGALQKRTLEMSYTDCLSFGTDPWPSTGPDIGFLELPDVFAQDLKVRGAIFFDLERRREAILAGRHLNRWHSDVVVGVVASRTEEKPGVLAKTKRIVFESMFQLGELVAPPRAAEDHDYLTFTPRFAALPTEAANYKGVSGGGLWRIFWNKSENNEDSYVDAWPIGVAFQQTESVEGQRDLILHGWKSVYQQIVAAAKAKWPD